MQRPSDISGAGVIEHRGIHADGTCARRDRTAADRRGTDRQYLLERVDEAAVVQLYADGFASCR